MYCNIQSIINKQREKRHAYWKRIRSDSYAELLRQIELKNEDVTRHAVYYVELKKFLEGITPISAREEEFMIENLRVIKRDQEIDSRRLLINKIISSNLNQWTNLKISFADFDEFPKEYYLFVRSDILPATEGISRNQNLYNFARTIVCQMIAGKHAHSIAMNEIRTLHENKCFEPSDLDSFMATISKHMSYITRKLLKHNWSTFQENDVGYEMKVKEFVRSIIQKFTTCK